MNQFRYVQQSSNECKEALSEDGDFSRQAAQMTNEVQQTTPTSELNIDFI
jgi:hypothetical protein